MQQYIVQIVIVALCIIGIIISLFVLKRGNNGKKSKEKTILSDSEKSVQDFLNVLDIEDGILYTKDKYLISYLKIYPISIDLLSKTEKRALATMLTSELSTNEDPFKIIAVSRPVDIAPFVSNYMGIIQASDDPIQRKILKNEIRILSEYSLSGEVVERQFYFTCWEKAGEGAKADLLKRMKELKEKLELCKIKAELLQKSDIIKLCNLVDNPAYTTFEDSSTDVTIPFISKERVS